MQVCMYMQVCLNCALCKVRGKLIVCSLCDIFVFGFSYCFLVSDLSKAFNCKLLVMLYDMGDPTCAILPAPVLRGLATTAGLEAVIRLLQISRMSSLSRWSLIHCFSWRIESWVSFSNTLSRSSSVPSHVVHSRSLSFSRAPSRLRKRVEHRLHLSIML